MRTLIPPTVYRLQCYSAEEIKMLEFFFKAVSYAPSEISEGGAFVSTLLYNLIAFSEMWERPQPLMEEMISRFTDVRISNLKTSTSTETYCAFSKENSTVCNQLNVSSYDGNGNIYERDQYWNKTATILSQASVLLLSSKLDPTILYKYAKYLLDVPDGDRKELSTFELATHGTMWPTPLIEGNASSVTCSMLLLVSYVSNGGNLASLDKSCVNAMPPFNMTTSLNIRHAYFSAEDVYDGVYNSILSTLVAGSSSGDNSTMLAMTNTANTTADDESAYETTFIAILVPLY